MGPHWLRLFAILLFGLLFGTLSDARAQVSYTPLGAGGCFVNANSTKTDCAKATFSLMTGGSGGNPGVAVSGTAASNVTGIQIIIQNTTPSSLTKYVNGDLLTGFFWGLAGANGGPALYNGTDTAGKAYVGGSATARNSLGGNAILNPSECASVAVCTSTALNVGAYWASSFKNGGWTGTPGTFAGSYVVSTSGYNLVTLGQGSNIGTNATGGTDPSLVGNGNSSINFGIAGGGGTTPSVPKFPVVQDTVVIQLAFASTLSSLNLNTDLITSDIFFAYGTNPDATSGAKKATEPSSIALFAAGTLALGVARRRYRAAAAIQSMTTASPTAFCHVA